jgi:hypothetical protein
MRRLTAGLREPQAVAAHASRPAPITAATILRMLAIASAVALFVTLLGAPHATAAKLARRAAEVFAYAWVGSLVGLASSRLAMRLGLWSAGFWRPSLATGLLMTPPMSLAVWVISSVAAGGPLPISNVPEMLWEVVVICIGTSMLAVRLGRREGERAAVTPAPPKFLERLPLKLRGGEVWAVEAEDHYLRLHTSKGQDLILMRLADAITELAGIEGAQVHRSWWVARDAIVDARRGDGRATLTLRDGAEVPVSRTYAGLLRERGWI